MLDREQLIKERAYARWLAEGGPDGRHEDHWRQAEQEIDGENAGSWTTDKPNPPEMDMEPVSLPDQAGVDHDVQHVPPARSGRSKGR